MELNLGTQISGLRRSCGLTQEQLAGRLNVTFQAVSKWETGASCPDVALLPEIADVFGVTVDTLFGREAQAPFGLGEVDDLPWPDDDTLHAVLYRGHVLVREQGLFSCPRERSLVDFHYDGPALNVRSAFGVQCGDVAGDVTAGDSVSCGNVRGSVSAGDGAECGMVGGSVRAGDGVTCGEVAGNVTAGDSVECGDVYGDLSAGDGVECGNVSGSVRAGDNVTCGDVSGDVSGERVTCGTIQGNVRAESVRQTRE